MTADNPLGSFLRARRDRLRPGTAGVVVGPGPRRAPGLRRDELAALAGLSEAYYTRLERGRDRRPSAQVVDALARALLLDRAAHRHLRELAGLAPAPAPASAAGRAGAVSPAALLELEQIVDAWPHPATAGDDTGLILAANELARVLSPAHHPGTNAYKSFFLDPRMRDLYRGAEWERVAGEVVAGLRAAAGSAPDDPQLRSLVGELAIGSEDFRALWARYDVRPRTGSGRTLLVHPVVGPIGLRHQKLTLADRPRLGVVLFSPGETAADVEALERLRALPRR